ncbi:hypothetical protein AWP77_22165 [Escherichia coli]|nr:hypothetical protein AWP77_22165 [Escherichia coli]OKW50220.1 hypothetical protein AWP76_24500 [Escherichia coli]
MFHTIVSIKNDGHYFCRAGGNRPDGLNEPVTFIPEMFAIKSTFRLFNSCCSGFVQVVVQARNSD